MQDEVKQLVRNYLLKLVMPTATVVGIAAGIGGFFITNAVVNNTEAKTVLQFIDPIVEASNEAHVAAVGAEAAVMQLQDNVERSRAAVASAETATATAQAILSDISEGFGEEAVSEAVNRLEALILNDDELRNRLVGDWFPNRSYLVVAQDEDCPADWTKMGGVLTYIEGDDFSNFSTRDYHYDSSKSERSYEAVQLYLCQKR